MMTAVAIAGGGSLSLLPCVRECSHLQDCGALFLSLRQSLELDTGVNHHSLAIRFTARPRTRSPLSALSLPTPPLATHIYWTAAGSTSEPERIAKWAAILNHVQNVHTHEDPLYPKCEHVIRKTTDKSKWLQACI